MPNRTADSFTFEETPNGGDGGAIAIRPGGIVEVSECKFVGNIAKRDSGAIHNHRGLLVVTGSKFEGNTAVDGGGAIANVGNPLIIDGGSLATITGCSFEGNTADNRGNNIVSKLSGDVTCNDGNTFESSGGGGNDSDSDGNSPAGICTSPVALTTTASITAGNTRVLFKTAGMGTAVGNTCDYTQEIGAALTTAVVSIFPNGTANFLGSTENCASRFGRVAGDSVDILVEIILESNESGSPPPSPQEVIAAVSQNTAFIATTISEEIGIDVIVQNVGIIENPSASPSLSPAPTLSQQPTLSNKPSNEVFPSNAPTHSPTSTPTKAEDRTFNIVSSFKFDDSIRQWCLQSKHVRVNAKFHMRPCTHSRSKQKFYLDEHDQLRLRDHPTYCMRWKKKAIYLGYCPVGIETSKAKFTYEKDHQHFIVQKPRFQYLLGVSIHNKYEKVRLFKQGGNINDSTKSWSLRFVQQK
eukprot:scaffold797_cov408-Chaetoceros_neogracile.AAC.88